MARYRSVEEVRRYNWFKIIVLIILLLLLLLLSFTNRGSQAAVGSSSPTAAAGESDEGAAATAPEESGDVSDESTTQEGDEEEAAAPSEESGEAAGAEAAVVLEVPQLTAPALTEPLAPGSEVELLGTGTPGSDVRILLNGREAETVRVGADGTWRYTFTPEAAGELEVGLEAVGEDGEVQATAEALSFTVAAPEPEIAAPTVDLPEGEIAAGTYTLTGSGTPGSSVEVVIDGQAMGTATVDEDGTWSLDIDLPDPGRYDISIRALADDGTVAAEAEAMELVVEERVEAPVLERPTGQGSIAAGEITLSGTGTPGSSVEVVVDDQVVGTATVDEDGTWSLDIDLPTPGSYDISVRALADDGTVAAEAEAMELVVEEQVEAPVLERPTGQGSIAAGEVELNGTGIPGSRVVIEINGREVETVEVDEDGNWSYLADLSEAGDYEVVVRAVDESGEPMAEAEPVTITTTAGAGLLSLAAGQGQFTSLLAALGAAPALSETLQTEGPFTLLAPTDDAFAALPEGAAEALLEDEEALLRLLQYHLVEGRVDIETALAEGTLSTMAGDTITVTVAEDETVLVGGVPLLEPDIEAENGLMHALDSVLLPPGDTESPVIDVSGVPTFEGPQLTIVGTAEPGTTLVVIINGEIYGTTTVEADGSWLVSGSVEDGEHRIVAYTLDTNGIPLARSSTVVLISPAP